MGFEKAHLDDTWGYIFYLPFPFLIDSYQKKLVEENLPAEIIYSSTT